jgi:alkaline phosphatase
MKLRNQLLALACLLAFLAAGYLYVRTWVVQKPYGIILFVSDGLVSRHLTMARLYDGGADHQLAVESFPHLALLRNDANDFAVPDDAAVATALAAGVRVNHKNLSMDQHGQSLVTIAALARKQGRAVGIVTNGRLTDPAPAAFYAHLADARETEKSALQMVEQFRPDVALGGGATEFLPAGGGGKRADGRNLLEELKKKGCEIVRTKAELEDAAPLTEDGIIGLFSNDQLAFSNQIASGSQQPSLSDMVRRAITFLQQSNNGYLLIVDAALVGDAAQRNEGERAITETIALDRAIVTAVKYSGEKSLVLAVGKHSTGGLSFSGYPLRQDHGVALLGTSPEGYPYLSWASGPNGPASPPTASLEPPPAPAVNGIAPSAVKSHSEPAAFLAQSALNNAEDVLAFGLGMGAEKLHGVMNNTAIFEILKDAL